jgi:hypothetical protein
MADSTSNDYWETDQGGGWTKRTYRDGTVEWRQKRGDRTKWVDSQGRHGEERDRGGDWKERTDRGWGKDIGRGWIRWEDGSYTRDRSGGGK